jgi:hypothetical protein
LSLVLWSSVPGELLLERAENGALSVSGGFEAEVRRMLADPRFYRFSEEFGRQWLRLERRPLFRPSLERRELVEDSERLTGSHREVAAFLARQLAADRPIVELLTAKDPELNASTAPATTTEHAGLLTSRALLSAISTPIRGGGDESWLGRGLVVESAFLCRSFPLAAVYPYDLWQHHPLLDPSLSAASKRPGEPELLAIRTRDKPCRECHRQLETIGAALAGFDGFGSALGSSRPQAVEVAGETISGPRELAAWVLESGRFEPCVAQKLLSYVLGRAVLPAQRASDRCLVQKLTASGDASFGTWLWQGLTAPEFRAPGAWVVRDKPTPSPNSNGYTDALSPLPVSDADCQSFDPGGFLVENCGTSSCHGPSTRGAFFAVSDREAAATSLREGKPSRDGYCAGGPKGSRVRRADWNSYDWQGRTVTVCEWPVAAFEGGPEVVTTRLSPAKSLASSSSVNWNS